MAGATESMVGRPRKYKDEEAKPITVRLPQSVRDLLAKQGPSINLAAYEVIVAYKELTDLLDSDRQALRLSAIMHDQEYSTHWPETIARLVKLGLVAEKATPDPKKKR